MHLGDKLVGLYEGYYEANPTLQKKREIAARQTALHVSEMLTDTPYKNLLDVGAGEGSFLAQLAAMGFAKELHAVEVSDSGIAEILRRNIPNVRWVQKFDGYHIPAEACSFELGTAVHVLEHVEHERAFVRELCRVCKVAYIEVPLELTARIDRAIEVGRPFGHINFYNVATFRNLLVSSGVEILDIRVFPNSREYETHLSGSMRGTAKYLLRTGFLKIAPRLSNQAMSYLAGAVCRLKS